MRWFLETGQKTGYLCEFGDNSGAGRYLCGKTGHSPDKREWARKEYIWSGRNTAGDSRGRAACQKSAFGCQDWRTPVYKGGGGRCNSYGGRRIIRSNCRR